MIAALIIEPEGTTERRELELAMGMPYPKLRAVLKPLIDGEIERVRVWARFEEALQPQYCDMFVDEDGQQKDLKPNLIATAVYWSNVLMHQGISSIETWPMVRGRAILLRERVWS